MTVLHINKVQIKRFYANTIPLNTSILNSVERYL